MKQRILKGTLIVSFIAVTSVFFQNCGVGSFTASVANEAGTTMPASVDQTDQASSDDSVAQPEKPNFSSFHFYFGGWFPEPNQPNWSDDINFTLKGDVLSADSKTHDESCVKPTYVASDSERKIILNLIAGLKLVIAKDLPPIADAGSKFIKLKLNDGTEKTIFLRQAGAQNGDTVATNGSELGDYLQSLNKKIPIACKTAETTDLLSFTYFNGGGYPAPGMPAWTNDMQFRITASGVVVKSKVHDTLCFKPEYTLSSADAAELLTAALGLEIKNKTEPVMVADAPTNKVTLTLKSGEIKVVHLSSHSAATGDLLATNGASFAQLLQALDKRLPMACH